MGLIVNKTISIAKVNDDVTMVYQDGTFKSIECDYNILSDVLNIINKFGEKDEVYNRYKDKFNKEEVDQFLDVLISENMIIVNEDKRIINKPYILLVSDEITENIVKEVFKDTIAVGYVANRVMDIEKIVNSHKFDCVFIANPDMKYEDAIWANKLLVKLQIPFMIVRYDGENIITGPFIFPMKGACLECSLEHHIDKLNENENVNINIKDLYGLSMTKPINPDIDSNLFCFCLEKIKKDILKLVQRNVNFHYFQREESLNVENGEVKVCEYYPTTGCNCCNGMTQNLIKISKNEKLCVPKIKQLFKEQNNKIKYMKGGLRSVSAEETQNIINKALNKTNVDINLRRVENKLKNVLPVYRADVNVTHKNNTPYFFQYQRSFGKGITEQQALFSCTFELMERLSSHYYGDIALIRATPAEVKEYRINIESTMNQISQIYDRYEDFDENKLVDWVWGQSLITNEPKLIPASRVFLTGVKFKGDYVPVGSSGLSAGALLEDAILQGLFEVIEHDAWCIGQSNTTKLPIIDYTTVKKENTKKLIKSIENDGFKIISRDYTTDIGIPTIRTWIIDESNYIEYATNGFGSSVDPEIALERSITEAVQGKLPPIQAEISEYGRKNLTGLINSRDSIFNLGYFKYKDMDSNTKIMRSMDDFDKVQYDTVQDALEYVVSKVSKATGGDVLFVDLTNENLGGIPAVKVVVTGNIQIVSEPLLCPSKRMLEFNKLMKYSNEVVEYTDLYLGDYPH